MYTELFIYHVGEQDFSGETAWGDNWVQAKAAAIQTGETIYRTVIKTRHEVFSGDPASGGLFLGADPVR